MNMKKILASVLAASMALSMAVTASAADTITGFTGTDSVPLDEDGKKIAGATVDWTSATSFVINEAHPNDTYYVWLGDTGTNLTLGDNNGNATIDIKALADGDYFKLKNDKDKNGTMISSMSVETDINKEDIMRKHVLLKIVLKDSTMVDEKKVSGTITLSTKSEKDAKYGFSGTDLKSGDELEIDYTLWVNNTKAENDDNPDTGDRIYFDPDENEDNVLIWGDDRAALEFEADDDAGKFYARLSTKSNSEIYAEYGDPVNADLYFYDFVGNPTIPSTSRATLTLGIPWDEDDDYVPDPEMCYIYEIDADGYLTDVTDLFTYSEDEQEIDGWSIRTRTLGTYVLSDTELDIEVYEDTDDTDDTTDDADTVTPGKEIPNTGANDMVNVAVVAAVVSLAAAGAVAFKKSSK